MKINKDLYVVILAGGSGTRFWPLSRQKNPKQFLNITGKQSLLQNTIDRVQSMVQSKHIYIVTGSIYKKQITQQIRPFRIPPKNILLEPKGKNTAPAICWAAAHIHKENRDAVMVVLPSDHLILNKTKFLSQLKKAVQLAQKNYLVTLGIVPSRPETGYGYLKIKSVRMNGRKISKVEKFTEKPSLARAKQLMKTKKYLWNSGMFIWRCDQVLLSFKKHLPKVYNLFHNKTDAAHVHRIWDQLPGISVDYGILEKAKNVVTVPASNIGWSDLGSFESLMEVLSRDYNGNIIQGDVLIHESKNVFVCAGKRLVSVIGMEDAIVVDTDDALLVCRRDQSQHVKCIVDLLKKKQRKEF